MKPKVQHLIVGTDGMKIKKVSVLSVNTPEKEV